MPTYEYRCLNCSTQFAVQASMQDPAPTRGPDCSGNACALQKCLSRVFGQVAGAHAAPVEKKTAPAPEKPTHVCSKYCDLHK